ncbi:MAG: molybdenum cofactor guanylyltransferase [Proteobacteria bacterium]|nr:molybdenum cofactor guanylyltransferase [Pseudomonadota bacterium]
MIGAIMTGGASRRMGFNKAFIETDKATGETILSRTVSIFQDLFDETVIVTADASIYSKAGVPVLTDIYPDCGSLGGIFTALKNFPDSPLFIAACDMPHIDPTAIEAIITKARSSTDAIDAAVPYTDSRYHPLHAYYTQNATDKIEQLLKKRELRVQGFIDSAMVLKLVEADFGTIDIARSVANINTPEELENAGLTDR